MTPIIEEYIYELTRAIGDFYMAVSGGIGKTTEPGTALFELNQLYNLSKKNMPYFGILRDTNPDDPSYIQGFIASVVSATNIHISSGKVGYNKQIIVVPGQDVSYERSFASAYTADHVYGVNVGLPLSEVTKINNNRTTLLSQSAAQGVNRIVIDDSSVATDLGFPLNTHIDQEMIVVTGVDENGLILQSALQESHYDGAQVYFAYMPRLKSICGLPVAAPFQAGGNPDRFAYYPPFPKDWIRICRFLVTDPAAPSILEYAGVPAIQNLVVDYPYGTTASPVFSDEDARSISTAIESTSRSLLNAKNTIDFKEILQSLQDYTSAIADTENADFASFWGGLAFRPTSYFARGISYDNIERFEFSDSFKAAYYETTNQDLQHTFAIFRGDMCEIGTNSGIDKNTIAITKHDIGYLNSTLTGGTYIYGFDSLKVKRKSSAVYKQAFYNTESPYIYEISGINNGLEGKELVSYNIYRSGNNQIEYRIADDTRLMSLVVPPAIDLQETLECELPVVHGTPVSFIIPRTKVTYHGSAHPLSGYGEFMLFDWAQFYIKAVDSFNNGLAWITASTTIPDNNGSAVAVSWDGVAGASEYIVYMSLDNGVNYRLITSTTVLSFTVYSPGQGSPVDNPFSNDTEATHPIYLSGGVMFKLRFEENKVVDNIYDGLDVYLYTYNTGALQAVNLISTGTRIPYGVIASSADFTDCISRLGIDPLDQLYINNLDYAFVLVPNADPVDGSLQTIKLYIAQDDSLQGGGETALFAETPTGTTSQVIGSKSHTYSKILGFLDIGETVTESIIDKGVKLTGEIAPVARRLQLRVPKLELTLTEAYSQLDTSISTLTTSSNIHNGIDVTVVAKLGEDGVPVTLPSVQVLRDTARDTIILLGTETDIFDRVVSVSVKPIVSQSQITNGKINWSVYDLITIETTPNG